MGGYSDLVAKAKAAREAETGTPSDGDVLTDRNRASTFSEIIAEESEQDTDINAGVVDPDAVEEDANQLVTKRALHPHDDATMKTPFLYDVNALSSLRPDQVPRFFGALTDGDQLPAKQVPLNSLVAMQDRVDPKKVDGRMKAGGSSVGKRPVVVRHNGKNLIADGHHGLTADWLAGKTTATVGYKDLSEKTNAMKNLRPSFRKSGSGFEIYAPVQKVDADLGIVFGWAIICKDENGQDYFDAHEDHIPEDAMLEAAADFMANSRVAKEMHAGEEQGTYLFCWPMTGEIAKAMGFETKQTGLMVGMKPNAAMLKKFKSGELKAFSIGGWRINDEEVT